MLTKKDEIFTRIDELGGKTKLMKIEHNVVLLASTADAAVLYRRFAYGEARIQRRGDKDVFDAVQEKSSLGVISNGFDDPAILIYSPGAKEGDSDGESLLFHYSGREGADGIPGFALLLYWKSGHAKLHVREISVRNHTGLHISPKCRSKEEFWFVKAVAEPILVSWHFRLDWHQILNDCFGV